MVTFFRLKAISGRISPISLGSEVQHLAASVGLRVREARQRRRWNAEELAGKLGISERTLRKLEKGNISVSFGSVLSACVLLDVDFTRDVDEHVMRKRVSRPRAPDIAPSETDF